jgi:hypothetical protein
MLKLISRAASASASKNVATTSSGAKSQIVPDVLALKRVWGDYSYNTTVSKRVENENEKMRQLVVVPQMKIMCYSHSSPSILYLSLTAPIFVIFSVPWETLI